MINFRQNKMKTVGIIGGVGPETTAKFYLEIIFGTFQRNKISRPPILIWNLPLTYKIEADMILHDKGEERYLPFLIDAARRLEAGGADFLVLPSNTLHIFIDEIRSIVRIPILSIVEETVKFLHKNGVRRVGMIATTTTVRKKIYECLFTKNQITSVLPTAKVQEQIGIIINRLVLNQACRDDRTQMIKIINSFSDKKADAVLLACTDLQLLAPTHLNIKVFDSMKIYASATIEKLLM